MGVKYDKLFGILRQKGISKSEFMKVLGISSATFAKLSKNEAVSISQIEKICQTLNCQPGEIMSFEQEKPQNMLLATLREEKEMQLKGGIYHQTQVKFAYNSNRIEGSRLTEEQTRFIYETNTIGAGEDAATNIDDILETVNHFQSFDYLLDTAEELLTEDIIKTFHKFLKSNTSDERKSWFNVGDYKQKPNMVGDMETTPPNKVKEEMKYLLREYNAKKIIKIEDIIDFHHNFECIHPFQDGNGRVGRLIMFKECLKHNIVPFVISETQKMFYYRGLREYEIEKGYLIETCLACQDVYKKSLVYFQIE